MKYQQVAEILERRIMNGDYSLTGLPGERELASDCCASRMTVRRALKCLEDQGILQRASNRRLVLSEKAARKSGNSHFAFIAPSAPSKGFSLDLQRWQSAIESVVRQLDTTVRTVHYHHWDDPVISDSLNTFDGVFLVTNSEPIPEQLRWTLRKAGKVVVLSDNLSDLGIPSLNLFPHGTAKVLLEHLKAQGHGQINCFNVQGHNSVTLGRINEWAGWTRINQIKGSLFDKPCDLETSIFDFAVEKAKELLETLPSETTAIYCTTLPAAMGIVRAATDRGIRIGRDLAVCVVDGEGVAEHLVPSLTSLKLPEFENSIRTVIEWFKEGADINEWVGPLLIEPAQLDIFIGESTISTD